MTEPVPNPAETRQPAETADLPVDSAVEVPGPRHRPVHLHPGYVLLVMAGGCVGALARYTLSEVLPAPGGWPLPTLLINLAGAFALGMVLEILARREPDAGARRTVRLLVGTGFLGAFTTYSTLAVDGVRLLHAGSLPAAVLYLAASLFGGTLAALAGMVIASRYHRRTVARTRAGLAPAGRSGT